MKTTFLEQVENDGLPDMPGAIVTPYGAPSPLPLTRPMPDPEPFPIGALGEILGNAAKAIQARTKAPMSICGQSVLAVATLATQAQANVELPTGDVRPLSCDFVTVAESGERKTAVDKHAVWPINKRELALRDEYDANILTWLNDKAIYDKTRESILKNTKTEVSEKRAQLESLGAEPQPPLKPMILASEPTIEGLFKLYEVGQPSLGIFSSEAGMFIAGHGMREEHKLRTAAGLSSLWDGDPIRRVRAGDGASLLLGRRLSLHLMAQPGVAARMLSDDVLIDQGLLSRVLVTMPKSTQGTRRFEGRVTEYDAALKQYSARILQILEQELPTANGRPNELTPRTVTLDTAAQKMWAAFANEIEAQIAPGGDLEPIRGLANKLPEHSARLTVAIAIVESPGITEVGTDHLSGGIRLAQFYATEALRIFSAGQIPPELQLAQRAADWLRGKWKELWPEPTVSVPDFCQYGPNAIRSQDTARKVVNVLVNHHYLPPREGPKTIKGGKRQEAYNINQEWWHERI